MLATELIVIILVLLGAIAHIVGFSHLADAFSVLQLTPLSLVNGFLIWMILPAILGLVHLYVVFIKKDSFSYTGFLLLLAISTNPTLGLLAIIVGQVLKLKED